MQRSKSPFLNLLSVIALTATGYSSLAVADEITLEEGIQQKTDDQTLNELIDQMTHQEKAAILNGIGMDLVANIGSIQGRVPGAGGETFKIDRLGIPSIIVSDGPAGLRIQPQREGEDRTYYTTAFPSVTSLASSWNRDLFYRVGLAMGEETKEYGVDVLLAPGINIHRNPLNGRNFEYMSEDPYLSGSLAIPFIDAVQSLGIGTSLKHYAANNAETNRLYSNSLVSERAMREIYLRGFEIAVKESQPWTIMTSYNKINNVYANARRDLNTQILRDEWGFKGLVMTDWFAGYPGSKEMLDAESSSDAVGEITSGNDLLMPGDKKQTKELHHALENGTINVVDVDNSIRRLLKLVYQSPSSYGYEYSDNPDLKAHAKLARAAIAEGSVLLKNKSKALPLDFKSQKIALFNADSYNIITGGTGSSDLAKEYVVTIHQGLENEGVTIDETLKSHYIPHVKAMKIKDQERRDNLEFIVDLLPLYGNIEFKAISDEMINASVKKNDAAIITFARNSGETYDQVLETDFYLSDDEMDMLKRVSKAYRAEGKPVIVLLNIPSAIEVASWEEAADAILVTWYTGQEGGNGIADLLGGTVTPSAKLTQTFPIKYEDVPSAKSFYGLPEENPTDIYYTEGIYVGYRYYDTFDVAPAYPFGHGLSYTTFSYDSIELDETNFFEDLTVRVNITNTGDVKGAEVIQLYLVAPESEIDKPSHELKAFAKTEVLAPGESEMITMTLDANSLASFNPISSSWIADKGKYHILIGGSSRDIRQDAHFDLEKNIVIETVTPAFTEELPFEDLNH